jgi:hypothetical protein
MEKLRRSVEALNIGDEWMEHADLYKFLQHIITKANIESDQGEKLLELNPNFIEEFWQAKSNAYLYFFGWPRWLIPSAFAVRDRVIDAIKKWHAYGLDHGDYTSTGHNDPEWEPILGSKNTKARLQYLLRMKSMDAHSRAAEDWGMVFGYVCFYILSHPLLISAAVLMATPCHLCSGTCMRSSKIQSCSLA